MTYKTTLLLTLVLLATLAACTPQQDTSAPKTFESKQQIMDHIEESRSGMFGRGLFVGQTKTMVADSATLGAVEAAAPSASDFSTTNIQVQGVDEADIIKNDGKYIYTLSDQTLSIVKAYPAEDAEILSQIQFNDRPFELFINNDRLIIFVDTQSYNEESLSGKQVGGTKVIQSYPRYTRTTNSIIYDITDRTSLEKIRTISMDGYYHDSRMIDNTIYFITNQYIPHYSDYELELPIIAYDGIEIQKTPSDIHYFNIIDNRYQFTNIVAFNTNTPEVKSTTYLTGNSNTLYASTDALYITQEHYMHPRIMRDLFLEKVILPALPSLEKTSIQKIQNTDNKTHEQDQEIASILNNYMESLTETAVETLYTVMLEGQEELEKELEKEKEKTSIHKIKLDKTTIEYTNTGIVPGRVLNQFSMDEHLGNFRIATTTGRLTRSNDLSTTKNHVYVLDETMTLIGSLEDLAPGESIYSARFMGDRAYLVTFQKVDPLFVIDLSIPEQPTLLGKLKIPGYSDYLHPYDENHIIGLGKEAIAAEEGDFAWYQGVKLALFDVSDPTNPKELANYQIGDRGTESYALHDHKAFLFSKSKNLLVLPILLAEFDEEQPTEQRNRWQRGDYTYQGAYIFTLSPEQGIQLKGRITHVEDQTSFLKSGYYYYNNHDAIKRSLYMDNTLYTISTGSIKMNNLDDLEEVNRVTLIEQEETPRPFQIA